MSIWEEGSAPLRPEGPEDLYAGPPRGAEPPSDTLFMTELARLSARCSLVLDVARGLPRTVPVEQILYALTTAYVHVIDQQLMYLENLCRIAPGERMIQKGAHLTVATEVEGLLLGLADQWSGTTEAEALAKVKVN